MLFVEIIGNASTTAFRNGLKLGHNVNASLYRNGNKYVVVLESNGEKVPNVAFRNFTLEQYKKWVDSKPAGRHMLLHGLDLFNCDTCWSPKR